MTATFNAANIAASSIDYVSAVRFLIADTDVATAEVSDEMITALYAQTHTDYSQAARVYQVASDAAQYLHRTYAKQATFSAGKISIQRLERAKYWGEVADTLRQQASALVTGNSYGVLYARRSDLYSEECL